MWLAVSEFDEKKILFHSNFYSIALNDNTAVVCHGSRLCLNFLQQKNQSYYKYQPQ